MHLRVAILGFAQVTVVTLSDFYLLEGFRIFRPQMAALFTSA